MTTKTHDYSPEPTRATHTHLLPDEQYDLMLEVWRDEFPVRPMFSLSPYFLGASNALPPGDPSYACYDAWWRTLVGLPVLNTDHLSPDDPIIALRDDLNYPKEEPSA